jgi:hypothetical protein
MEKETKKWWLLATEEVTRISVSDDYYNHNKLFEKSEPFWGTKSELVRHIQKCWFTKEEVDLLKNGWQAHQQLALIFRSSGRKLNWRWRGTFKEQPYPEADVDWTYVLRGYSRYGNSIEYITPEELKNAPWLKHETLFDVKNAIFYLSFYETHEKNCNNDDWTKTLRIVCLDHDGTINKSLASEVITNIESFVTNLQSTI